MARRYSRVTFVERLRAEIHCGRPIYDALCGSGITAKMAARGGADMVTTHCLAYFRMQGMSSMAGYLPICERAHSRIGRARARKRGARMRTGGRVALR